VATMSPVTAAAESAQAAFVEEYGLYVERKGRLPRMAGRILAQLLIDEQPHLSQAALCEALKASAGAVSGTLRLLVEAGFVKRVSIAGSRKDFYRLVEDSWGVSLAHGVEDTQQFARIAELGVASSAHFGPLAQARLEEMRHLAVISEGNARQLLEVWEDYKRSHAAGTERS
jgi:DNA-binding MarR family transcriptional regulator